MTFLETKINELGRSPVNNTHNTRSLIRTYKYVPGNVAKALRWKSINTHTYTSPRLHKNIQTQTQIASKRRSKSVCGFSIILILKGVMTF